MVQLDEFIKSVDESTMSEELKTSIKAAVVPCFDFRNYLMDRLNIDDVQAEALIEATVGSKAEEMNKTLEDLGMDDYIEAACIMTADIVINFAKQQAYTKCDMLKESLIELMKFGINQELARVSRSN